MNYREHIGRALDYIEENLCGELDIKTVAAVAGYSQYHFIRVFAEVMRLTPADYIRKRRISEVVRELDRSDITAAEAAFRYGFNSKENFIRAFKAEHGILPTEYRRHGNSLRTFDRPELCLPPFAAVPELVTLSAFSLTVYESDEERPPRFWNKYNCGGVSKRLSGGKVVPDYGVMRFVPPGRFAYYIGIRTADVAGYHPGTVVIDIPGGLYARFATPPATHFNFISIVHRTWEYINAEWLPGSGYVRSGTPEFETYVEESRTYSEQIYVPIKPAKEK